MTVVDRRKYSRICGRTSDESETDTSGISSLRMSRTRCSCWGCRNENSRHTATDFTFFRLRCLAAARTVASSSGFSTWPWKSTRSPTSQVRLWGANLAGFS
jgi:hypothetical protein